MAVAAAVSAAIGAAHLSRSGATEGRQDPAANGGAPRPDASEGREPSGAGFLGRLRRLFSDVGSFSLRGFYAAIFASLRGRLADVFEHLLLFLQLSFPKGSLFCDPDVEELYQWHHMQHWLPRFDWSAIALVQMFSWDLAANPSYRIPIVVQYYGTFMLLIMIHKSFVLAFRGRPTIWRVSRCALICALLLGRGVVCHPSLLGTRAGQGDRLGGDPYGHSASALVGLGMTGLSAVLALRLHTLDTLMLCLGHGVACICWTLLSADPLGSSAHTLLAGHLSIASVSVWQQHEQERYDRLTFEIQVLTERGRLLRQCDDLARRGSHEDLTLNVQLVFRARLLEHINL